MTSELLSAAANAERFGGAVYEYPEILGGKVKWMHSS